MLVIAFLLAFVGGYADAASYLLTKSFPGHLTGNTVFLCLHLVQGARRAGVSNSLAQGLGVCRHFRAVRRRRGRCLGRLTVARPAVASAGIADRPGCSIVLA